MEKSPTVFAVDDDLAILDALGCVVRGLGYGYEAYSSAEAFLASLDPSKPGCLVLDMGMPGKSGEELYDQLREMGVMWPTIAITGHGEFALGVRMVKKGVLDFLEKPFAADEFQRLVANAIALDLQKRRQHPGLSAARQKILSLSEDQKKILRAIRRGASSREIAEELDLSLRTIQLRRSQIAKILGLTSRSDWNKLIFELGDFVF